MQADRRPPPRTGQPTCVGLAAIEVECLDAKPIDATDRARWRRPGRADRRRVERASASGAVQALDAAKKHLRSRWIARATATFRFHDCPKDPCRPASRRSGQGAEIGFGGGRSPDPKASRRLCAGVRGSGRPSGRRQVRCRLATERERPKIARRNPFLQERRRPRCLQPSQGPRIIVAKGQKACASTDRVGALG